MDSETSTGFNFNTKQPSTPTCQQILLLGAHFQTALKLPTAVYNDGLEAQSSAEYGTLVEDVRGEMMVQKARIVVPREQIEELCRKYHIRQLSLFGSVITPDFKPKSDVDVLVEFEAGYKVGLLKMAHIENELSALLGRKVDLRTPADLSRYFRQEVIENAEVQYAQG